ncbi:hypothetical protein C6P46_002447 [Rhodotorula mucilaginosa]|uniref:F-box domain-containing protein n=1 Tax=Rhodotorula mucilaginosa TaxID=5537 RepID=A0A9P6W4M0_RHOMI|nr:hypothetical protein C6P46_002447 [Rhodotorula mucilaginosa]
MSHDLLHAALNRHASQIRGPDGELLSPRSLDRLALSSDDENELVEVKTPMTMSVAGSVDSTPASSRSASPSRAGGGGGKRKGGAGKPRRDKAKEREKAEQMRNPVDPFLRFPGPVLGRILGDFDVRDLQNVGLVCKRWRRSQTLRSAPQGRCGYVDPRADTAALTDYTWYLLLESFTYEDPTERRRKYADSDGTPTWRKGDAQQDWAQRFANVFSHDVSETVESDHDENGLTMKEERELKWKEENEASEMQGMDKVAMREFYKGLRNKKVKGKYGKGSVRTIEGDGLGDVVTDPI